MRTDFTPNIARSSPAARLVVRGRLSAWLIALALALGMLMAATHACMTPDVPAAQTNGGSDDDRDDDDRDDDGAGERKGRRGPLTDAQIERLTVLRSLKMAELLELDDATRAKVDAELARYDKRIVEAHRDMRRKAKQLRRGIKRGASDADLARLTEEVIALRERVEDLKRAQHRDASKHLNVRQRAMLLLFLPEFDRKARRALRKQRRGDDDRPRRRDRKRRRNRRGRGGF